MFFYNLKIFFLRLMGYEKPLRVALLKLLSIKYKSFRPQYETILLESCLEAKKLGYKEITVLELGVAGGNGIVSLEKYRKKIQKKIGIIDIDRLIKKNFVFPNKLYAKQSPELHFNENGYKFIAEKIVEFINENEVK